MTTLFYTYNSDISTQYTFVHKYTLFNTRNTKVHTYYYFCLYIHYNMEHYYPHASRE